MEADWEIEVGGDAPVIEARWQGYVDLQREPRLSLLLPEAIQLPALGRALAQLNSVGWPVWTSKCDLWPVTNPNEFNGDELDAPAGATSSAVACYIDLLPGSNQQWVDRDSAAIVCNRWCMPLKAVALRACRVDFVIRAAFFGPNIWGHGVTVYITACGPNDGEARAVLERALDAFTHVICPDSTLQSIQWASSSIG